ncbi:MAG: UvrD-helicase domain-containing protein [Vicinamibacteria bacterium]|nr:UvrD-helicase domain-containing protein [Vicinamibacteria bacterium]
MTGLVPQDEAVRARVRTELGTSFVISAGAGTGKTTLLVDRMVAIVLTGFLRLDQIAAVTFTENAATTLKLRLRDALERARAEARDPEVVARASEGLSSIERAQVSTIHALCTAMLQERPIEAGVTPGFRVADEALSDFIFEEAWEEWLQDRLTGADDLLEAVILSRIPLERTSPMGDPMTLRKLARRLVSQRDLAPHIANAGIDPKPVRDWFMAKIARACELIEGKPEADTLVAAVRALHAEIEKTRGLDDPDLIVALRSLRVRKGLGNKRMWKADEAFDECRAITLEIAERGAQWEKEKNASFYSGLVVALQGVQSIYERRKNEAGVLDYVDLLVKAAEALRNNASLRAYFRRKFRAIIVDEYQDTDPLQVEIIETLAGFLGGSVEDPKLGPASYVVVGDPKQSIYRFRRADASIFAAACEAARTRPGVELVSLTQNFRSTPAILRFVNRFFANVIKKSQYGQPDYEALVPSPGIPDERSLLALRFTVPAEADSFVLEAEASAIAAFVAAVQNGTLQVRDGGDTRKSRAGDVLILARRLTQIRPLEQALERASVPFVVDGGRSFFIRSEVVETHAVLRAIDDPSDATSLVAALRSTFFGVSDRAIAEWRFAGRELSILAIEPTGPPAEAGEVSRALHLLRRLHEDRLRLAPAALIEKLFDETSIFAALYATERGSTARAQPRISNLRKVVHLARQAEGLGLLTLRGFNLLLANRLDGAGEEPDLPSSRPGDPHTVRVMTIHKAKGLEAPVVILYDCLDKFLPRVDTVPLREEGRIALGFVKDCQPPDWDVLALREEARLREETHRLRYVACTRAKDWLVVPIPPATERVGDFWHDIAKDVAVAGPDTVSLDAGAVALPEEITEAAIGGPGEEMPENLPGFSARRKALIAAASEKTPIPLPVREDAARESPPAVEPPEFVGRVFGSFVHRLLELADFSNPESVRKIAPALAPAFPLTKEAVARAEAQAEAALSLPIMREAARAARVFREVPISYIEEDRLLEGVCDLAFEDEKGWVVVDYKTEAIGEDQVLAQASHHAAQLRRYARGLALASGSHQSRRFVVFTSLGRQVAV